MTNEALDAGDSFYRAKHKQTLSLCHEMRKEKNKDELTGSGQPDLSQNKHNLWHHKDANAFDVHVTNHQVLELLPVGKTSAFTDVDVFSSCSQKFTLLVPAVKVVLLKERVNEMKPPEYIKGTFRNHRS